MAKRLILSSMSDIDFRLKNHGVTLTISEWEATGDIVPTYRLDEECGYTSLESRMHGGTIFVSGLEVLP